MINNGNTLEGEWALIDPQNWEGEWKGTRRWNRVTAAATQIGNDTVSIASKAGDIALTVGSTVGSAASTVLDGVEDAAGTAASYATMGLSAGQKIVSAWI